MFVNITFRMKLIQFEMYNFKLLKTPLQKNWAPMVFQKFRHFSLESKFRNMKHKIIKPQMADFFAKGLGIVSNSMHAKKILKV